MVDKDLGDALGYTFTATESRLKEKDFDPFYYPFIDWKITESFCIPRIMTNKLLTEEVEDWSRVRSPSRARRRMKQGHRQNVRIVTVPSKKVIHDRERNIMYCHPDLYRQIQEHVEVEMNKMVSMVSRSPLFAVLPETVQPPADISMKDMLNQVSNRFRRDADKTAFDRFSRFYNLDTDT